MGGRPPTGYLNQADETRQVLQRHVSGVGREGAAAAVAGAATNLGLDLHGLAPRE